jgi:hypothetical protein
MAEDLTAITGRSEVGAMRLVVLGHSNEGTAMQGFGNAPDAATQLSTLTRRLLDYCLLAIDGLDSATLSDTRGGLTNSIGFDVWHVVRTVDNIVHFVFEREQPVWLRDSFDERWGLPRVDQGTGMDASDAYGLVFPAAAEFAKYVTAVQAAVVPRMAAMTDGYLGTIQTIRPWGPVPRIEAIGHGLIGHGNGHLGRASYARTLLGLQGLPY